MGNANRKPAADPHRALGRCKQQNAAIQSEPTTVEAGCDFLASDHWEQNDLLTSSLLAGVACHIFCLAAVWFRHPMSYRNSIACALPANSWHHHREYEELACFSNLHWC